MNGAIAVACAPLGGCLSIGPAEPASAARVLLPSLPSPICVDYELKFLDSFNGDPDEGAARVQSRQERDLQRAALDPLVIQTGLVGFVGQAGLTGRLEVTVRREVRASLLHAVGSALTFALFPYWVEVIHEVRAEVREGEECLSSASASTSWSVVWQPFLVFAMPFDDPVDPVEIVERLAREALGALVSASRPDR